MNRTQCCLIATAIAFLAFLVNPSAQMSLETDPSRGDKTQDSRSMVTHPADNAIASPPDKSLSQSMESAEAVFKETDKVSLPALPVKEHYAVTVEVARVSWPTSRQKPGDTFGGHLTLGLVRPSYSLKKGIRINGRIDIRVDSILLGVRNQTVVSLSYSLERSLVSRESDVAMGVERVTFRLGFPFGR